LVSPNPVQSHTLSHKQIQAGIGALIGSAVADALGAPFEFKPAGTYKERFPKPILGGIGELVGGGGFGWGPGEFTDDTQMALALAEALLEEASEFDAEVVWRHFVAWAASATDIGNTTVQSLSHPDYRVASQVAHEVLGGSGSNGSVMRTAPLGLLGVQWGQEKTIRIAREQSRLTHYDEIAGWCSALVAEVIRQCILGASINKALNGALQTLPSDIKDVISPLIVTNWDRAELVGLNNSSALVCFTQAVWAIRSTQSFEDAVVAAVNLGGDADTVAAVCGAMAGAVYGIQQIPARWVTYVNGVVRQPSGEMKSYKHFDLSNVAHQLLGKPARPFYPPEPVVPVTEIHEAGMHASNFAGAQLVDPEFAVISLCRTEHSLSHVEHRREFYIIDEWDEGHNPHLHDVVSDAVSSINSFLREGKNVLIHCHGGRSRTGLILKAWYMLHHDVDHEAAHYWLEEQWPHYVTWNSDFNKFLTYNWGTK